MRRSPVSKPKNQPAATRLPPDIDPVRFELIKNATTFLVNEMTLTLVRASYSGILREMMDLSTGIATPEGELVGQGLSNPLLFGPMPVAIEAVARRWKGQMEPGDVFVLNDPFDGGTHLPDVFFIKPVFEEGEMLCYVCAAGHQVDVGGRVAGSNACDSREIYAEGLRIPPLKLYERGVPNATFFEILERNVRVPVMVLGDFRAHVASLRTGEQGVRDLLRAHGVKDLRRYWSEVLDYTERLTRQGIARLPAGTYGFTDYLDSDGIEERPVPLTVKMTISGDEVTADFRGSSPQVAGAINSTLSMTLAETYFCVRSMLGQEIPNNSGFFRPIKVIADKGSILDCVLPAASGGRGVTLHRLTDTLLGALGKALPDRVFAACEGGPCIYSFGSYDDEGRPFVYVDLSGGAWGGRPDRDGVDGIAHPVVNQRNAPVEMIEVENPLEIWQYGFLPDTGGAGKYRGGLSLVRDFKYVGPREAQLQIRSDRYTALPYGLAGGGAGTPSMNYVNPGTPTERPLKGMVTTMIKPGDVVRFITPGAGGYGNPLERDPEAVRKDVVEGKLTRPYVETHYGVAIRDDFSIDRARSAELRARRR